MVLQSNSHAKHELKYHFVWCPKYRRFALKGNIGKYVAKVNYEVATRYDFSVMELAVMPDHVHMFVSAIPDVSPAHLIQVVKNITARKILSVFLASNAFFWGGALRGRGYFVMSSDTGTTDEMIRKYIKEQRDHANDKPSLLGGSSLFSFSMLTIEGL